MYQILKLRIEVYGQKETFSISYVLEDLSFLLKECITVINILKDRGVYNKI